MKKNQFILFTAIFTVFFMFNSCKKDENINSETELLGDQHLPYTNESWMSKVDGSLHLDKITIPGTHDSGADKHTSKLHVYDPKYDIICQDFDINNQLRLGVRWLDIRLRYNDGELQVHHSKYYLHKTFEDVIVICKTFLNNHPSETIVLMIKQEDSDASDKHFGERVYYKIKKHGLDNFYLLNKVPTLDDLRGKIFIVRRFQYHPSGKPLGIYANWPKNTKGSYQAYNDIGWHVQDHYSLNTVSTRTKEDEVKGYIHQAHIEKYDKRFFLNFVSGERVSHETLWQTAEKINPEIQSYIVGKINNHYKHCGVILINFAGGGDVNSGGRNCAPSLVKYILELNDGV